MHLTNTAIALLIGSLAAAAPSTQHAQISVEITHTDAQNHADVVHSTVGTGTNSADYKTLPFNFTIKAQYATGGLPSLPFGFENLNGPDGFIRGELGFPTVFALRGGKIINGNRALAHHAARNFPGWTSLWPLEREGPSSRFDFIANPRQSTDKLQWYLSFENRDKYLGVFEFKTKQPVFVGPLKNYQQFRLFLEAQPVQYSSNDINAEYARELL